MSFLSFNSLYIYSHLVSVLTWLLPYPFNSLAISPLSLNTEWLRESHSGLWPIFHCIWAQLSNFSPAQILVAPFVDHAVGMLPKIHHYTQVPLDFLHAVSW